ncbi:hypothetical protein [Psychrobacter jeotgali]|uniref:hypothetical protein n=1 Tax=Psychrobacter jeotgali TaxID=179010 RepID=UPI001919C0EE|nr:hypothetical protein [Psychrobacter jeotgali]
MGYITYPRTSGSAKDIKRAEHVLLLIERLLQHFNPSDLNLLLSLVSRIGWGNLPAALRARLLRLLYYNLFAKIQAQKIDDASVATSLIQSVTKALVDIALQLPALSDSSDLLDMALHERINKTLQVSVSHRLATQGKRYEQEILIFDNGIHVILTACASRDRYINDQQKELRAAIRLYDADTLQTLKQAHKKGVLVTLNLLSDYIVNDSDGVNSNGSGNNNRAEHFISYDFKHMGKGMLAHSGIRRVVLDSIGHYLEILRQQNTESALGYKRAYLVSYPYFITRLIQDGRTNGYKELSSKTKGFGAWSFWVEDSQTQGTECRFLTLQMVSIARQFKIQGHEGSLLEWLDKIEAALFLFFTTARYKRGLNGLPRHYSRLEAELIATAIRQELQQHLSRLNIPMTMTLSNQLARLDMVTRLPDINSTENSYVYF